MKRILIPTKTGSDWQPLLAKPKLHWKMGASAMTAAAAWEAANGSLPAEIATTLNSSNDGRISNLQLLIAIPEWEVPLEGGDRPSSTDILAICRNEVGLCIIAVEAKVHEAFGPPVVRKRTEASPGQSARLRYLESLLHVSHFEDNIRYQLVHRTASALLTAQDFHAQNAVMLIQAWDAPTQSRNDYKSFCLAMSGEEIAPFVYQIPEFENPNLYLVWCDGDPEFLKVELPSAL